MGKTFEIERVLLLIALKVSYFVREVLNEIFKFKLSLKVKNIFLENSILIGVLKGNWIEVRNIY